MRRAYTSALTPWGVGIGTACASDIDCGEDIGTCAGLVCDGATAKCKAANVSDGFGCALPAIAAGAPFTCAVKGDS